MTEWLWVFKAGTLKLNMMKPWYYDLGNPGHDESYMAKISATGGHKMGALEASKSGQITK